ncbi:MAG: WYL domain-containing protein, partial [Chloroflexi bacterium]|nr:WYL domain-containing protein [Chloroflexota bacterium]
MRADRLLSILLMLQVRGPITARHLAETLEVSERTIYRDLDALSAAGIPVYAERGPGGGCALSEGYRTNLTGLSADEVRTLFFAALPGPLADLGLGRALDDALLKLLAALPSARRDDAERFRQRIMLDSSGWFAAAEPVPFLPLLQEAVWTDQRVRIVYRRGDRQEIERVIDALGLVAKTSIWYLAGAADRQTRIYRVSRVLSADLTGEYFDRPADFDLAARWVEWVSGFEVSRAGYETTVRFAPGAIPLLPRVFGESLRNAG